MSEAGTMAGTGSGPAVARSASRAWVASAAVRLGVTEGTVRRWIRTGRLNPSCGQVYAQVLPYLDRELSLDERAAVERHIAACPGCEEHFAFDGMVLKFVRQRAPRPLMPEGLESRLLAPFRARVRPDS
jgi:anti-sigma factor (TIGR02949 family)